MSLNRRRYRLPQPPAEARVLRERSPPCGFLLSDDEPKRLPISSYETSPQVLLLQGRLREWGDDVCKVLSGQIPDHRETRRFLIPS